jgi:hypothetical protein
VGLLAMVDLSTSRGENKRTLEGRADRRDIKTVESTDSVGDPPRNIEGASRHRSGQQAAQREQLLRGDTQPPTGEVR